ncbi:MAG: phosphotransferase family protein [Gammaproteobacteria bacterium]
MIKNEPILKSHWERYRNHCILDHAAVKKLVQSYSKDDVVNFHLLSDGCANSNYRVDFATGEVVVLRIYLRENESLMREVALHESLVDKLPVPKVIYYNKQCKSIDYPYAVLEFIDGELMRNVILSGNKLAIEECAFSAGKYLNHLRSVKFPECGFFEGNDLKVRSFTHEEEYIPFVHSCLKHKNVIESLGEALVNCLYDFFDKNKDFLPDKLDANLTHADYDPSNMIVKKINGHYEVIAILDWEFSFSGSYLLDLGQFLRYSHKLPEAYEHHFIRGMFSEGTPLPEHWKKSAKLMDMICLLSLLYWNSKKDSPNLVADVVGLIQNTIENWSTF